MDRGNAERRKFGKTSLHRGDIGAGDNGASVLDLVVRDLNHPLEGKDPGPQWGYDGRGPSPTRLAEVMDKARAS